MMEIFILFKFLLLLACRPRLSYGTVSHRSTNFKICNNRRANTTLELESKTALNSVECAIFCTKHSLCKSSNFIRQKKLCVLMPENYSSLRSECNYLDVDVDTDFIYMAEEPCYFQMPYIGGVCKCARGFSGDYCERPPRDCFDLLSGLQKIYVYPSMWESTSVRCITKRIRVFYTTNGTFGYKTNAGWNEFKDGFETPSGLWLGNEIMHRVTKNPDARYKFQFRLQVDVNGASTLMEFRYYRFVVSDSASNYTVSYSSLSTSYPTDNILLNGQQFRSYDYNDNGCVSNYSAAFWYPNGCPYPSPFKGVHPHLGLQKTVESVYGYLDRL